MKPECWLSRRAAGVCLLGLLVGQASGQIAPSPRPAAPLQPGAGATPAPAPQMLPNPFDALTPDQQTELNNVLGAWERGSEQVKSFQCEFKLREYIAALGQDNVPDRFATGEIQYNKPDKGRYQVKQVMARLANGWGNPMPGEDWYCDGKSVYEINHEQKQVIERPIPPAMQGEAIRHGPLPFLFGMTAKELSERYWLTAPRRQLLNGAQVWQLRAAPRWPADAENYRYVDLMLTIDQNKKLLLPLAIRIEQPNGDKQSYELTIKDAKINPVFQNILQAFTPQLPLGYKRIVDAPTADIPPEQAQAPTGSERLQ